MTGEQPPEFASTAALAGLARELEALRRTVDGLPALAVRLDNVAGLVAKLAGELAAQKHAAGGEGPASWLGLPADATTAAGRLLADLIAWMGAVYLRYTDAAAGLPDCWLFHPDVVEELLWLCQAWQAAYAGEQASIGRAGDWHDRQRPGVARRIRAVAGMCSIENHQPGHDQHTIAPTVPLADAAGPIARWWATDRTATPPPPTDGQLAAAAARRPARGRP